MCATDTRSYEDTLPLEVSVSCLLLSVLGSRRRRGKKPPLLFLSSSSFHLPSLSLFLSFSLLPFSLSPLLSFSPSLFLSFSLSLFLFFSFSLFLLFLFFSFSLFLFFSFSLFLTFALYLFLSFSFSLSLPLSLTAAGRQDAASRDGPLPATKAEKRLAGLHGRHGRFEASSGGKGVLCAFHRSSRPHQKRHRAVSSRARSPTRSRRSLLLRAARGECAPPPAPSQ